MDRTAFFEKPVRAAALVATAGALTTAAAGDPAPGDLCPSRARRTVGCA
jgi:hypothetical protein